MASPGGFSTCASPELGLSVDMSICCHPELCPTLVCQPQAAAASETLFLLSAITDQGRFAAGCSSGGQVGSEEVSPALLGWALLPASSLVMRGFHGNLI